MPTPTGRLCKANLTSSAPTLIAKVLHCPDYSIVTYIFEPTEVIGDITPGDKTVLRSSLNKLLNLGLLLVEDLRA